METNPLGSISGTSLGKLRLAVQVCEAFDVAWQRGERPSLQAFLETNDELDHRTLFADLLAIELSYRARNAEVCDLRDYAARFPGHIAAIDAAFAMTVRDQSRPVDDTNARGAPSNTQSELGRAAAGGELTPGSTFGRFRIIEQIGYGSFGVVYSACDLEIGRTVALKIPRVDALSAVPRIADFLAEARAAGQLQHPGIIPIYEAGVIQGVPYICSRFVDGVDLRAFAQLNHLPVAEAARIVESLAEALHHAHSRGVFHRDIKPANILMPNDADKTSTPLIGDFGLARHGRDASESGIVGTAAYMSPEQAAGKSDQADARSDLWSLGVVFYELLTRQRPFPGQTLDEILKAIQNEPVRPPRKSAPEVPRRLEAIVLRCLARDPEERYPTCRHLVDDLARWRRGEPIEALREPWWGKLALWARRERLSATLATAVVFACAAGVVGAVWSAMTFARLAKTERLAAENARAAIDTLTKFVSEEEVLDSAELQPLRLKLMRSTQPFYDELDGLDPSNAANRRAVAESRFRFANVAAVTGDYQSAQSSFEKAIQTYRELLSQHPDDAQLSARLARLLAEYGGLMMQLDRPKEAHKWLEESIRICNELLNSPDAKFVDVKGLAVAFNNASNAALAMQQPDLASQYARDAQRHFERLLREQPENADYVRGLAHAHNGRGRHARSQGRLAEGRQEFETAIQLLLNLPDAARAKEDNQRLLSTLYNNLASAALSEGRLSAAYEGLVKSEEVAAALAGDHPNMTRYQLEHAMSLEQKGVAQSQMGDEPGAIKSIQAAIDKFTSLQGANDTRAQLARCYRNLSSIYLQRGDTEKGIAASEIATRYYRDIVKGGQSGVNDTERLAASLAIQGKLLVEGGRHEEARPLFQESMELRKELSSDHPESIDLLYGLADSLRGMGDLEHAANNADKAAEWYSAARDRLSALVEKQGNHKDGAMNLADIEHSFAETKLTLGDTQGALELLRSAISRREEIQRQSTANIVNRDWLARYYYDFAVISLRNRITNEECPAMLSRLDEVTAFLQAESDQPEEHLQLRARGQFLRGVALDRMNRRDEAGTAFDKSQELTESASNERFREQLSFLNQLGRAASAAHAGEARECARSLEAVAPMFSAASSPWVSVSTDRSNLELLGIILDDDGSRKGTAPAEPVIYLLFAEWTTQRIAELDAKAVEGAEFAPADREILVNVAVTALGEARRRGFNNLQELEQDPRWQAIRETPPFQSLIGEMRAPSEPPSSRRSSSPNYS